jgi:uncharacterized protein
MAESCDILTKTEAMIRERLAGDSSGHDWWHIHRVRNNAVAIARAEGADEFLVELAALLHDIADWKFHGGSDTAGPRAAREWLSASQADPAVIDQVCEIIAGVSFKGAGVATDMPTLEGRCVQDADRLDAIGAIGIGRAFAFGGHFGRLMYDPAQTPQWDGSFAEYKTKSGPTINHFYEKLLLLKDRMQTPTGRQMAAERHAFMEQFLDQFFREWGDDDFDQQLVNPVCPPNVLPDGPRLAGGPSS